jgi:hypothetical protein
MITYTIEKVDLINKQVLVKYQNEGHNDWYRKMGLPDSFDDDYLHALAEKNASVAAKWWKKTKGVVDNYVVAEPTKTIKEIVLSDEPDFDPQVSDLTWEWTEDATTKYKKFTVTEKSPEDMAFQIRERRNQEIGITDIFALSDRTMSDEMKAYRKALRDITKQETFPNSVVWPIYPI